MPPLATNKFYRGGLNQGKTHKREKKKFDEKEVSIGQKETSRS